MSTSRLAFIDSMKVLGMVLIVLGHTGAQELFSPTPPFNFKQLGVAFFVFVMGYSLAGETRSTSLVFYNRMFEVWLFGLLFAVAMSVVTWIKIGDFAESNYLPLFLGVNVAFNFFPANPTTWYIGTYCHLLVLWAVALRHVQVRPWMIMLSLVAEIIVRALLIPAAGNHIAYMALTNWLATMLLGLWCGQNRTPSAEFSPSHVAAAAGLGLIGLAGLWPVAAGRIGIQEGFPFALLASPLESVPWIATSAAVSFLYLTYTWLTYILSQRLPSSQVVEFLARNTLIVFIVHMPLIYAVCPLYYPLVPQGPLRVAVNLLLFFFLPACLSELIRRTIHPLWWRDQLRSRLLGLWLKVWPTPGCAP